MARGWGWTHASREPPNPGHSTPETKGFQEACSLQVASEATKPAGRHSTRTTRDRAPGLPAGQFVSFPCIMPSTELGASWPVFTPAPPLGLWREQGPPHLVPTICLVFIFTFPGVSLNPRVGAKPESHLACPCGGQVGARWKTAATMVMPHSHTSAGPGLREEPWKRVTNRAACSEVWS